MENESRKRRIKTVYVQYPFSAVIKDKRYIVVKSQQGVVVFKYVDGDGTWHMIIGPRDAF